jgi:hypothetical protein
VLVSGCVKEPVVKINGVSAAIQTPHQYDAGTGRLVLELSGSGPVEIEIK